MSRTTKSIRNSQVALIYAALLFLIGFFSRKVFLDHLGAELLGLNTTAVNLLQFLNIAEMGIGTAIACTLYKPLAERDQTAINEIISLQGWLYRNIALFVMGASAVLMCFFPMIFGKSSLPLWYAYATFSVLLFNSLLDYFVNYKQIILSANQEQYKILYGYHLIRSIRSIFQIGAIIYLEHGYIWWLVIEVVFTFIASLTLRFTIRRSAPDLHTDTGLGSQLRSKYPDVITKVRQVFIHKIGGFVLSQTQPLIIYAYATLSTVAYYGNYMFIILGLTQLTTSLFNGMAASVGNLVVESDDQHIIRVFEELFTTRFLFVATLCVSAYIMIPQFITLWIGSEYIMSDVTVILMLATFFIRSIRSTVDEYLAAYGMFHDVWAPVIESTINISISILLGYFYGINGVLCGAIVSLTLVIMCWRPYFLFRYALHRSIFIYIKIFGKNMLVLLLMMFILRFVDLAALFTFVDSPLLNLLISGSLTAITVSTIMTLMLYPISQGIRDFVVRVRGII